jgi:LuxR family quorum-sensing system transcriptional regulator CciR
MTQLSDVHRFIELSKSVREPRDLDSLIADITKEMGFDYYALIHHVDLAAYSSDLDHIEKGELVALWNYPEAWVEEYHTRNIVTNDPVLLASQRTNVGFVWEDMGDLIKITPLHRAITDDTRRAGLAQGFTVPAHIPGETNGSCNFAVRTGKQLPRENLAMAQLVGSFAFQAARTLVEKARRKGTPSAHKRLGNRQLECIALVARGKSDWEIGQILGISEFTVRRHLMLAKEHYEVASRYQVVTRAMFEGQISISDVLT